MPERFDPDKDTVNLFKHKLPLAFGDSLFRDPRHEVDLIDPTDRW